MSLQVLQDRAVDTLTEQADEDGYAIDPALILLLVEIVPVVINMIKKCTDDDLDLATEIAGEPTWFQRAYLKRRLRRELGRRAYREYGDMVYQCLLGCGEEVTEEELSAAFEDLDMEDF